MSRAKWPFTFQKIVQNKKVLLSLLRSFTLVFIVPFLISIMFYVSSLQQTQRSAIDLNNQVLTSASERVDLRLQEVNQVAHEIVRNPAVRTFQGKTAGFSYPNSYKMIEVRSSLSNYTMTQYFVDEYFILFNASQIVMNNSFIYQYDQFFSQYLVFPESIREDIVQSIRSRSLTAGLHPAQDITLLGNQGRYLTLLQPLLDLGDGYLCILINEETLTSMFRSINLGDTGCVYILGEKGELLTSVTGTACDLSATRQAIEAYVQRFPGQTAFSLPTANGEMLVNQLFTDTNGLTYISAQPMNIVLAQVNVYQRLMLIGIAASLIIGLLLCYYQARQLSKPMFSLMDAVGLNDDSSKELLNVVGDMVVTLRANNENLNKLAQEHRALLRSSFTSRLLRGSFASETEALHICQYVCPENANFSFARTLLLHLQASTAEDEEEKRLKLLGSMKLSLKDVLETVLPGCLSYDLDEETLALIIFDREQEEIDSLFQQMLSVCPPYLRDHLSAFGGRRCKPPLPKISRSFESARITMMIHQLSPMDHQSAIIWADKRFTAMQYFYPADMRYRLTECIIHGMQNEVVNTLNELFHVNLVEHPVQPAIFRLFVSELLSTAVSCVPLLSRGIDEEDLAERIVAITNAPAKRQCALLTDFLQLLTSCAESNQCKTVGQINQVKQYIEANFRDSSLSLASIAETFALNPSVLSTAFKQQTGKNLSSYLEELRIREAQHLLRTTNWTINRIAEETGYLSASSFCRAFRRNTGQNTSTYKALAETHGNKEES